MFTVVVAILALIVGFFLANVITGKHNEKKHRTRTIKVQAPQLSIEDKVMMRAGYASYSVITHHLSDGDHHYLVEHNGMSMTPVFEVVLADNGEFDLVRIEQGVYA